MLALLLPAFLLLPFLALAPEGRAQSPQPVRVDVRPIPAFHPSERGRTRFGRLLWRGGIELIGHNRAFGGISGIAFSGDRLIAITDAAHWLSGRLVEEGGRPTGFTDARIAPLTDPTGTALKGKHDGDAEALALDPAGQTAYVAFEGRIHLYAYPLTEDGIGAPARPVPLPPAVAGRRTNEGIEALALAPPASPLAGRLIAIGERWPDGRGDHTGFILGKGEPQRFSLEASDGFAVTDAAFLPDGRLVLLERRYRGGFDIAMRLRLVAANAIAPGRRAGAVTLMEAGPSHEIDNMEGVAVSQGADGEILITVASDDNFLPFERTLLLRFALIEDDLTRAQAESIELGPAPVRPRPRPGPR